MIRDAHAGGSELRQPLGDRFAPGGRNRRQPSKLPELQLSLRILSGRRRNSADSLQRPRLLRVRKSFEAFLQKGVQLVDVAFLEQLRSDDVRIDAAEQRPSLVQDVDSYSTQHLNVASQQPLHAVFRSCAVDVAPAQQHVPQSCDEAVREADAATVLAVLLHRRTHGTALIFVSTENLPNALFEQRGRFRRRLASEVGGMTVNQAAQPTFVAPGKRFLLFRVAVLRVSRQQRRAMAHDPRRLHPVPGIVARKKFPEGSFIQGPDDVDGAEPRAEPSCDQIRVLDFHHGRGQQSDDLGESPRSVKIVLDFPVRPAADVPHDVHDPGGEIVVPSGLSLAGASRQIIQRRPVRNVDTPLVVRRRRRRVSVRPE